MKLSYGLSIDELNKNRSIPLVKQARSRQKEGAALAASQRPLGCFPLPLALGHTPATAGRLAGQATCQDYGAAGGRSGCAARGFARLPAVDLTSGESQAIRGVGSGRRPPSGFRPPLLGFGFRMSHGERGRKTSAFETRSTTEGRFPCLRLFAWASACGA